jgi:hypothetical protein
MIFNNTQLQVLTLYQTMGYSTFLKGFFKISPPLSPQHLAYLQAFSKSSRITWFEAVVEKRPDPLRFAVGLPVGPRGCFFVGFDKDQLGHGVLDEFLPPGQQPRKEVSIFLLRHFPPTIGVYEQPSFLTCVTIQADSFSFSDDEKSYG